MPRNLPEFRVAASWFLPKASLHGRHVAVASHSLSYVPVSLMSLCVPKLPPLTPTQSEGIRAYPESLILTQSLLKGPVSKYSRIVRSLGLAFDM